MIPYGANVEAPVGPRWAAQVGTLSLFYQVMEYENNQKFSHIQIIITAQIMQNTCIEI